MPVAHQLVFAAMAVLLRTGALDPEPPFKVLAQMTGPDSLVEAPKVMVAKSAQAWEQVWFQHKQTANFTPPNTPKILDISERPVVDFKKNVVLCLFAGQSRGVAAFEIAAVGELKGTIVIRLRPQLLPSTGPGVIQNPYMMLVVPRTKKKTQVQLDQSQLGGEGWRVLADFGPTVEK